MPCLAARTDARVHFAVIADGAHLAQGRGAVADQGGAFYRIFDFAVFYLIGLGAAEHEFAVGDVYLPAAEIHRVYTVFYFLYHVFGCGIAAFHDGVGHARHRGVGIALPPPVAGGGHTHQAGVLAVLHIANQNAVFDQHIALARGALVVKTN